MAEPLGGAVPPLADNEHDPGSPPHPAQVDPAAIREAAERRLARPNQGQAALSAREKAEKELKLRFLRLIDGQIVQSSSKSVATTALETLLAVTSNALEKPEGRFKRVKTSNPAIRSRILCVPGGRDYLLLCRFAPRTVDFAEVLQFPLQPSPTELDHLRIGRDTLRAKLVQATAAKETEERMKRREEAVEGARVANALQLAEADRERKRQRDAWAKQAREAKAASATAEKEREASDATSTE